jgi:hypothetical protein
MRVWLSPDVVGYVPRSGPQLDQMTVGSVVQAALARFVRLKALLFDRLVLPATLDERPTTLVVNV